VGRDGERYAGELGQKGMEIFLKWRLDRQITFFAFLLWPRHSGMRRLAQVRNP
jgi:hypothetical protein